MSSQELPKSSERPPQPNNGAPTNEGPLDQLAALLRAEKDLEAEKAVEEEAHKAAKAKAVKPKSLAEVAKLLTIDDADVYAVQVPSSIEGADPYTIGKLKDLAKEHDEFTVKQLRADDELRQKRAEVARSEEDLRELFAALPPDAIKPEKLEALKLKRNKAIQLEGQRLLAAIPEWQDATVRNQDLEAMVEHLKDYGFSPHYLTGIHDHQTLRYIRENWRRERQIRAALEKVTERKPTTPPKARPSVAAPQRPNRQGPGSPERQAVDRFMNTINAFAQKQR